MAESRDGGFVILARQEMFQDSPLPDRLEQG